MVRQVWTSNSGTSELFVDRAAEMKIISKKDSVLLDLLLHSNLLLRLSAATRSKKICPGDSRKEVDT